MSSMRGMVAGGLWGLVLGACGLAVASLVSEPPVGNAPDAAPQLAAPTQDAPAPTEPDATAPLEEDDVATSSPSAQSENTAASAQDEDAQSLPQQTDAETSQDTPVDVTMPEIVAGLEEPVVPAAPQVPGPEEGVPAMTEPAIPDLGVADPDTGEVVKLTEEEAASTADALPTMETESAPVPAEAVAEANPVAAQEAVAAPVSPALKADTVVPATPEPEIQAPQVSTLPQVTPAPAAPQTPELGPDVLEPATPEVPQAPQIMPGQTQAAADPEPALPTKSEAVKINRPAVTAPEPVGEAAEVVPGEEAESEEGQEGEAGAVVGEGEGEGESEGEGAVEEEIPEDAPAIARFASSFENLDDLPVIGVLLIDDGKTANSVALVSSLPTMPTVILDPMLPDAAERMAAYREAGIEIGMQIAMPEGATPADVEVAFEAAFATLSEAVVLYSDDSGVLRGERNVTDQVLQILAASGRGLVTFESGLAATPRSAAALGVPVGSVLREIDGAGEDRRGIARALDQAAFRARQTGDVILLGHVSEETIASLKDWAQDARNRLTIIAPVSAAILPETP